MSPTPVHVPDRLPLHQPVTEQSWTAKLRFSRHELGWYALAVVTVALAALLRWELDPLFGHTDYPFFLFNLAVIICSWYGTLGSSLFCALLGGLVADYLFVDPRYTIGPSNFASTLAVITYLLVSVSIALFAEAYRRALRREASGAARLKLALEVANASTFDYDPQSKTFTWSEEHDTVFGIPRSKATTLTDWVAYVHVEDRERVAQIFGEIATSAAEKTNLEYRIIDEAGRQHWVHARIFVSKSSPGDVRVMGAKINITDLKRTEAALLRSEKLASAAKLAATVAHELNNPLAAATNLVFLAKETAERGDVKDYLEAADCELARVASAARRTLAFYKEHAKPGTVAVEAVIRSAAQQLSQKIDAKQLTVSVRCADSLHVPGVAGELTQAISNLLANSVDAVALRGRIRVHAVRICRDHTHQVRVYIADNGPGIPIAQREHLFEPFFSTKGPAGTGLGLWITDEILRRHSGRIRIRSRSGRKPTYTVVCINLPAIADAEVPASKRNVDAFAISATQ